MVRILFFLYKIFNMKKILLILFLNFFSFFFCQIKWLDISEIPTLQTKNPKKILLSFVDSDYIFHFKKNDSETFSNPIIGEYINKNFYPVRIFLDEKKEILAFNKKFTNAMNLGRYLGVHSAPSLVFIDEKNTLITQIKGALSSREIEPYLYLISSNQYKKLNQPENWIEFQNKFKSKIK